MQPAGTQKGFLEAPKRGSWVTWWFWKRPHQVPWRWLTQSTSMYLYIREGARKTIEHSNWELCSKTSNFCSRLCEHMGKSSALLPSSAAMPQALTPAMLFYGSSGAPEAWWATDPSDKCMESSGIAFKPTDQIHTSWCIGRAHCGAAGLLWQHSYTASIGWPCCFGFLQAEQF